MPAISEISKCHKNGTVDYTVRIYLGRNVKKDVIYIACKSDELIPREWRQSNADDRHLWLLELKNIKPGTGLKFRLEHKDGRSIEFVPIGESDVVNGVARVPDYMPDWLKNKQEKQASRGEGKMEILLEHSLEGLLANYQDGTYFTDAIEELLDWSIADRILQTDIPEKISELGYSEIMFPLYASVADRCHLDPKFNYLVYNLSPDWQLGTAKDLRKLVHRFRSRGVELVPDLVFVHQVRNPYDGCSDDIGDQIEGFLPYQDPDPFLFRNYGTWHFDLKDDIIREIIIDKIIETVSILDLRTIRVDYIDGLVMQYLNKPVNYGATLLRELKTRLNKEKPNLRIIGEAFQTASEPSVRMLIDSAYAPRGFALLDLLLAPGRDRAQVIRGTVEGLTEAIASVSQQSQSESNYSQLHDECWQDEWISFGRPHTPWAYGMMPLGLCLKRVDELLHSGWITTDARYPTAVALLQLLRNLGLSLSFTRWMETTGSLSLDEGRLDDHNHWKFPWDEKSILSRALFQANDLDDKIRSHLLKVSRKNITAANELLRRLGSSETNPMGTPLKMVHGDVNNGVAGYIRWGRDYPNPALLLVNLSPIEATYQGEYIIDLQSVDLPINQLPPVMRSLTDPISATVAAPLVITQSRAAPYRYQLDRAMQGFETAFFEVRIHGS